MAVMKLMKQAQAGTLESSDCLVTVDASPAGRFFEYRGANASLFQNRTKRILDEILDRLGLADIRVQIVDQGALELTLRARIETAIERSVTVEEAL